jgi:hypothetical protein
MYKMGQFNSSPMLILFIALGLISYRVDTSLTFSYQVLTPDATTQLSSLSLNALIPEIISGKVNLYLFRGFYIQDSKKGMELFCSFLVKHIIHNYDPIKFKTELNAINDSGILSCVLLKENLNEADESKTLFEELQSLGLYTALIKSNFPLFKEINLMISLIIIRFRCIESHVQVSDFILGLPFLKYFDRLEELGPILFRLVTLREFDEETAYGIIGARDNHIDDLREWAEYLFRISINEGSSFYHRPLSFIHDIIETRREILKGFVLNNAYDLFKVVRLPSNVLEHFGTNFERALIVIAILLFRSHFDLEIIGGESTDICSQLSKTDNNDFIKLILETKTGVVDEVDLREILLKHKTFGKETIGIETTLNFVHYIIKNLCLLITSVFYHLDKEEDLNSDLKKSQSNVSPFFQQLIQESNQESPVNLFLDLVVYKEFENIFGFIFDRYFKAFKKNGVKIKQIAKVVMILQALNRINEPVAFQLIDLIDFEDQNLTSNVMFLYIEKLDLKYQQAIEKRLAEAYLKRKSREFSLGEAIEQAPRPSVESLNEAAFLDVFLYSGETEEAFREFSINEQGNLQIHPDSIVFHIPVVFDQAFDIYLTVRGFYFIIYDKPKMGPLITIIPFSNHFKSVLLALTIIDEITLVFQNAKFSTYLNVVYSYFGSVANLRARKL